MQFNSVALAKKIEHLDKILSRKGLLEKVLASFAQGAAYDFDMVPRPWEPGGGSTLFRVRFKDSHYFLKVKHLSVTVESKLESEKTFPNVASLKNEYEFLKRFKPLSINVPQTFLYVEEDGFGFLLQESLTPFTEAIKTLTAPELVDAYRQIEAFAETMFVQGVVHTDIHELNIMFRGKTPVLIDFEEARHLNQGCEFTQSLDYSGRNPCGNVGEMPRGEGRQPGWTCLERLRQVFKTAAQNLDSGVA